MSGWHGMTLAMLAAIFVALLIAGREVTKVRASADFIAELLMRPKN